MKTFLKTLSVFVLIALVISGCTRDEPTVGEPRLFIPENQRSFIVEYGVAATLTIDVESNRQWIITPSASVNVMGEDWAFVTPESLQGENNGQITVTLLSNPGTQSRNLNLTIATAGRISQQVTIIQYGTEGPPPPTTLIYAEDFGTDPMRPTPTTWATVSAFEGWNTTGSSAATIWYEGTGATIRTTNSSPTPQFSGGNVLMFAGFPPGTTTGGGGTFTINGVMPDGYQNFFLSFGTNQTNDSISAYISIDNKSTWTEIPFIKTTTTWGLVEMAFSIPVAVDSFSLRFSAPGTSGGARIDDIELRGTTQALPPLPLPTDYLTVTPTNLDFFRDADTTEININSNVDWTIVSSENWATVSSERGSNSETVEVFVTENTTGANRSATLTISGEGVSDWSVTITQRHFVPTNLMVNGSFENWSGDTLEDWRFRNGTAPGAPINPFPISRRETTIVSDGTSSLSVPQFIGTGSDAIVPRRIFLPAGDYTWSFDYRAESGQTLNLRNWGTAHASETIAGQISTDIFVRTPIQQGTNLPITQGAWRTQSVDFTVPAFEGAGPNGEAGLWFVFELRTYAGTNGGFIDNVRVVAR
ncbi:MAG: BACON domain-containing protein [Bacteroidales bacterium]|nr:BACON domain-containing protein [Bacteroidales bacterium]